MKLVGQIQSHIETLYAVSVGESAGDYLIGRDDLLSLLRGDQNAPLPKELFLVNPVPKNDTLEIALFFDESLAANLERHDPMERLSGDNISDFCTLIEGVSHFVYYLHKASLEHEVTELEMELQAEVDKFVLLSCFARGEAGGRDGLLALLFEDYALHEGLSPDKSERYRTANDLARKYCHGLLKHLREQPGENFLKEIRSFYPLRQEQKIQHILA